MSSVEYLAAFKGIHATLAAEEKLKGLGARPSLIPSPRAIETDCGFSVLIPGTEEAVRSLWAALGMPGTLYRVTRNEGERRYDEIR